VRKRQALQNFCWTKRECCCYFGIFVGRRESGAGPWEFLVDEVSVAGSSGNFVGEVAVEQAHWDFWWTS
jgi:hypothetical protein